MADITFSDLVEYYTLTEHEITIELQKLLQYDAAAGRNTALGNKLLYHYQFKNLSNTSVMNNPTFYEKMTVPQYRERLNARIKMMNPAIKSMISRVINAGRCCTACSFFKAPTAMHLYHMFNATKVLDPTAGWGGRLLGAWALGIDYIGYDTNTDLEEAYAKMVERLPESDSALEMRFQNCMTADFSEIDYDCVLTSPPYYNQEMYPHMEPFASRRSFNTEFLIPLIEKCLKYIRPGGWVCFNMSPQMYNGICTLGFPAATKTVNLPHQKRLKGNTNDRVFCWRKPPA